MTQQSKTITILEGLRNLFIDCVQEECHSYSGGRRKDVEDYSGII